jgi:hypothetical protein
MTGGLLYSLLGERRGPIEIQRALGARSLQNRRKLPAPVGSALAKLIALRVGVEPDTGSHPDGQGSCYLLHGVRL